VSARYPNLDLTSHPANTLDCYSTYTEKLACGADLWPANLDFVVTIPVLQPQQPKEEEGLAAS